ncbi:MAG TPA: ectonucleotide pyrophosphatase/phosphodiesterase [Acidimicrobiales bacterium]|nr:ectonucleotide pyrophosphatase/phosphodiesterase [Acidimicrobiales bacterium]
MSWSQRTVVGMIDGFGPDYWEKSSMPNLDEMAAQGIAAEVDGVYPAVTNANNVSIACAAWPEVHGITGNSYFDPERGEEDYMEDAGFVLSPTVFQLGQAAGVQSALLSAKRKTLNLLSPGTTLAITAEDPPAEYIARYGPPPEIYSAEINHWLWRVAIDLLEERPDLGLIYVHTTDFPMHAWSPERAESKAHLTELDRLLGEARRAAPDAAFFLTADHGMNFKTRCWDLARACANRGIPVRYALSAEKDRYVRHHRTFGGAAWVWLTSAADATEVSEVIGGLKGVELVLPRAEAASRFRLKADRIGDLVVCGDRETVFGELGEEYEALPESFRSHGSLHEQRVPAIVWNADLPSGDWPMTANADLLAPVVASWANGSALPGSQS